MSDYKIRRDPTHPNAITIETPNGKRIRITDYDDGRIRFRLVEAGPMHVQERYLTGRNQDVIVSVVPEGWVRKRQDENATLKDDSKGSR